MAETEQYIAGFELFQLTDDTPNVEGPNWSIGYTGNSSYNFADREAYSTNFVEEAGTMARIVSFCSAWSRSVGSGVQGDVCGGWGARVSRGV